MEQERRLYPSDLSDQQWESIKGFVPPARSGGRRRTTNVRRVIDAIFYVLRSGCPWRYLPKSYPPWKTVHDYFSKWSARGIWQNLNLLLSSEIRKRAGRKEIPSLAIVDSQSIRSHYGESRGYDAAKKIRGRKRSIFVDTIGLILSCEVHAANITDPKGGLAALDKMSVPIRSNLNKIIGDIVYKFPLDYFAEKEYGIKVENLDRKILGTNMKPTRWVVERTFAWFNHFRRLSRDYERLARNSEAMIYLAMICIMTQRLAR
jgi:putative transposase